MKKKIPGPLWIAIIALAIISVLSLLLALRSGSVLALVAAALNVLLLFGLAAGHKWAYILTIVFSVLGAALAFGKGGQQGLAVLLSNGLVLVPVLITTKFFLRNEQESRQQNP